VSEIRILHEDEHLVAVSKPSGLLVHRRPDSRDRAFLVQRVGEQTGRRLYPAHRIDRAASGIVVFATSSEDARWVQASMTAPEARKEYLVLLRGQPPEAFSVFRPLSDDRGNKRVARTTVEAVTRFDRATLARIRLHTGRHHQIRRHMNHMGHHVVGDTSHGKGQVNREFRENHGLHRLFLHHTRLELHHVPRGDRLAIEDPLPQELQWVLDRLAP
jgi:tRNA pseudouridine65 synthase